MGRLAVSGKNISFDEPASYHKTNADSSPVIYKEDKPFLEACDLLTLDEIGQLMQEVFQTSNEPSVRLALIRQSVISAAANKQASSRTGKTWSKPHTQSSHSIGGTMPERHIGDQGMFGASNVEFRDNERAAANIITPNVQTRSASISSSHSARLLGQAIKREYRYAMLGLTLGLATIIGGVILGLHGVVGSTSWTAKLLGLESNLNDATPGVVLFIVGIFLVLLTRPKVNLDNLKG